MLSIFLIFQIKCVFNMIYFIVANIEDRNRKPFICLACLKLINTEKTVTIMNKPYGSLFYWISLK